jgi:hypothetical protein
VVLLDALSYFLLNGVQVASLLMRAHQSQLRQYLCQTI